MLAAHDDVDVVAAALLVLADPAALGARDPIPPVLGFLALSPAVVLLQHLAE